MRDNYNFSKSIKNPYADRLKDGYAAIKNEIEFDDGGWRYQAVYIDNTTGTDDTHRTYTICEVYLNKDGSLKAWTENSSIAPSGETLDELAHDLRYMTEDIAKWKPVAFNSLQVGMVFERN